MNKKKDKDKEKRRGVLSKHRGVNRKCQIVIILKKLNNTIWFFLFTHHSQGIFGSHYCILYLSL